MTAATFKQNQVNIGLPFVLDKEPWTWQNSDHCMSAEEFNV